MKHPETCGKSIAFDGMYICKYEYAPCLKVERCPKILRDIVFAAVDKEEPHDHHKP